MVVLETQISAAPLSGDKMFYSEVNVLVPSEVDLSQLQDKLDLAADGLGIDVLFELIG